MEPDQLLAQAYYSFMLESAWRDTELNVTTWLEQWGNQRCGKGSAKAVQAWGLLAATVYGETFFPASCECFVHHVGRLQQTHQ